MSQTLHRIMKVNKRKVVEWTEEIRRFFEDNELMDCVFSNDEGEIALIVVDDIVLDELEKMVDWELEPEDSNLRKFKKTVERDLKREHGNVFYRVF